MSAWWRRANDRAVNLGMSMAQLTRRVHGQTQNRDMVELALALEETLQKRIGERRPPLRRDDAGELAGKAMALFRERTGRAA